MMTTICNSPNYANAQNLAYETLKKCNQSRLPVSIKLIIKNTPNLHIQKYSTFSRKRNLTIEETYEILDSEEGCLWMRSDNEYIILYNDLVENKARIRFTLAHELGHFILKHNELCNKTTLARYSLTDSEYDIFEKEANYFAKRLLAPIPILDIYASTWQKMNVNIIESVFDVSYTVAHYVIDNINKRYKNANIIRETHPITDNFIEFINWDLESKVCNQCNYVQVNSNKYCLNCGHNDFILPEYDSYSTYNYKRRKNMNYSKIETNENGIPIKCPKCDYENLNNEFNYCPICATFILNICLGDEFYDDYGTHYPFHMQQNNACAGFLSGDHRYCSKCGSTTSFNEQKLLKPWEEEKEEHSNFFKKKDSMNYHSKFIIFK